MGTPRCVRARLLVLPPRSEHGQLGIGSVPQEDRAVAPRLLEWLRSVPVRSVSCGGNHSTAVTDGGELYSWGANSGGQLGTGASNSGGAARSSGAAPTRGAARSAR